MCSLSIFWDESFETLIFYSLFFVPWQAPYPSGQNAAPTTLVYPQAPQTMNTQTQTRSPVREPMFASSYILSSSFACFSVFMCVSITLGQFSEKSVLLNWKHLPNGKSWLHF